MSLVVYDRDGRAKQQLVSSLVGVDPWHIVGSGGVEPAFQNSWVNFGGVEEPAQFKKWPDGRVTVKGLVKNGTMPSSVFQLPPGYRPPATVRFPVISNELTTGYVYVLAAGGLVVQGGSNAYVDLGNVEFDTGTVIQTPAMIGIPLVTSLAGLAPYEGMVVDYDAGGGIKFRLRYNAGSASAYKWEHVGGAELFADETASHNPLSSTVAIDKNGGPNLVLPLAGDWDITFTGEVYCAPNNYCYVGMHTAANALIGSWFYGGNFGGFGMIGTQRVRALGLIAQTIKARVMLGGSGSSGYVQGVRCWAKPVRVG